MLVHRVIQTLTISFACVCGLLVSCADKPEAPTAPPDTGQKINDTLYLPVLPALEAGLNAPADIHVGREPFLYIADTGNDRIVMMDLAGRVVGTSRTVKRPVAIAQDGLLNLLVAGELDTTINGVDVTIGAVYRIALSASNHRIADAPVSVAFIEPNRPDRRYTGVTVLPANSYLVTRTGPLNSSPFDPDNAVLLISTKDELITPISSLKPIGNALNSLGGLSGIAALGNTQDFVFTQIGADMQYRAQWLRFFPDPIGDWGQKFDPTQTQNDFLTVGRFTRPEDIAADNFGNIYIVDAGSDSVYKFTSQGRERHSFGGTDTSTTTAPPYNKFRHPSGIAFFDKTVYVADTGNNRILRFRLSTDQQ